jgi:hypothetical protein
MTDLVDRLKGWADPAEGVMTPVIRDLLLESADEIMRLRRWIRTHIKDSSGSKREALISLADWARTQEHSCLPSDDRRRAYQHMIAYIHSRIGDLE